MESFWSEMTNLPQEFTYFSNKNCSDKKWNNIQSGKFSIKIQLNSINLRQCRGFATAFPQVQNWNKIPQEFKSMISST